MRYSREKDPPINLNEKDSSQLLLVKSWLVQRLGMGFRLQQRCFRLMNCRVEKLRMLRPMLSASS